MPNKAFVLGAALTAIFAASAFSTPASHNPDNGETAMTLAEIITIRTEPSVRTGYADVNGLHMYYERHGSETGTPLVLLHGAFSAIRTSFGAYLPELARNRPVIAVELQGHGRTADIDRPLTLEAMASDVIALLDQLGIGEADFFGYSMGSGVALAVALQRPDIVRKLGLASASLNPEGLNPGLMEGMDGLKPEHLIGSPFHDEYLSLAPRRTDFARLVEQVKHMNANIPTIPNETFRSIEAPVLIVIGDSDIVRPEHAVELFRMVGGGVIGDAVGLPNSQLAILPGTSHVTLAYRADLLVPIINGFLDAPVH